MAETSASTIDSNFNQTARWYYDHTTGTYQSVTWTTTPTAGWWDQDGIFHPDVPDFRPSEIPSTWYYPPNVLSYHDWRPEILNTVYVVRRYEDDDGDVIAVRTSLGGAKEAVRAQFSTREEIRRDWEGNETQGWVLVTKALRASLDGDTTYAEELCYAIEPHELK